MTMRLEYALQCTVQETLTTEVDASTSPSVLHQNFNVNGATTDTSTTIPVSQVLTDELTLSAGPDVVSLVSYTATGGATANADGLKVQMFIINNLSTTNSVVIEQGASLPYFLFGATGDQVTLQPESRIGLFSPNNGQPVGVAANQNIQFTGTAGEKVQMILVMG